MENQALPAKQEEAVQLPPSETPPVDIRTRNMVQIQNSMASAQVSADQPGRIASLSFSWNMPVGLSVFQRGKYIWIIFDHAQNTDIENLQKPQPKLLMRLSSFPTRPQQFCAFCPKQN